MPAQLPTLLLDLQDENCAQDCVSEAVCAMQVAGHVEDAVAKGATVTIGGSKPDLPEPYNKVKKTFLTGARQAVQKH